MDDWEYDNWNNWGDNPPWKQYKEKRASRQGGGHVMSKPEAKVMRRLQAETGLSEEEIREHKKYRKMLSDAQTAHIMAPAYKDVEVYGPARERFFLLCETFGVEEEIIPELWKRYAGGLLATDSRPKNFHYANVGAAPAVEVLRIIHNNTDGQFYYNTKGVEVGFMYKENLTMFLLAYQGLQ